MTEFSGVFRNHPRFPLPLLPSWFKVPSSLAHPLDYWTNFSGDSISTLQLTPIRQQQVLKNLSQVTLVLYWNSPMVSCLAPKWSQSSHCLPRFSWSCLDTLTTFTSHYWSVCTFSNPTLCTAACCLPPASFSCIYCSAPGQTSWPRTKGRRFAFRELSLNIISVFTLILNKILSHPELLIFCML